ncbi:MAG: hypothetical protein MHM6MM_003720 [Cercozoa sp. M6MM]
MQQLRSQAVNQPSQSDGMWHPSMPMPMVPPPNMPAHVPTMPMMVPMVPPPNMPAQVPTMPMMYGGPSRRRGGIDMNGGAFALAEHVAQQVAAQISPITARDDTSVDGNAVVTVNVQLGLVNVNGSGNYNGNLNGNTAVATNPGTGTDTAESEAN